MLLTSSPRTTLPKHSAGWQVMCVVWDRGGKNRTESPSDWGKHRLLTAAEAFAILERRVRIVASALRIRETRP